MKPASLRSTPFAKAAFTLITLGSFAFSQNSAVKTPAPALSFSVTVSGAGQSMILIPGLESSSEVWSGVIDHYKSKYQLHAITLAGFAGQPAIPGLRLSNVKDDVIRYIRDNKLAHPVLVGHSLGGFLALWIAASIPDQIDHVIAVDGVPYLPALFNPAATAAEAKRDGEQIRTLYASLKPDQLEGMTRMSLTQMITDPKYIEIAAKWAAHSDGAFVGEAVYDLMTTDLRQEMVKIRAPVLLVGAGKALASNPERLEVARAAYEKQMQSVPNHNVVLAANALHFIMFDDPAFLMRTMDEFLAQKEAANAR